MNDYREVQSYLSHGLFNKKKKQYYKTDANDRTNYFSNIFESKETYDNRVQKYKTDKRVAAYNKKKSMDSIERTANHIDLMKLRAPYLKSFRDYANKLAETYSVITNAKSDISKAGSNSSLISAAKNKIANAEKKIESLSSKLEQASYMITGAGFSKEESLEANAIRNYKENGIITEEGAKKAAQLFHSSLEEEYMNSEYTEINAYLQHGLFDIFKSKPKYNSTGSAAGMPSNIHLGDSYNPTARASAIQDEIVRISKKLAEYENGEVKAKADYDRYKKLVKETKAKLSDLEKARANAVTQSVNSNTKQTTVTSSVPNKTKLVRTNPIFDRDVANLRKRR